MGAWGGMGASGGMGALGGMGAWGGIGAWDVMGASGGVGTWDKLRNVQNYSYLKLQRSTIIRNKSWRCRLAILSVM